jgi:hypothetical protein
MNTKRRAELQHFEDAIFEMFKDDIHATRVLSIANAVVGIVAVGSLVIHAIGRGLAAIRGISDKNATKQVDRLLSNEKFNIDEMFKLWVPFVVAGRDRLIINLDWTEFDDDNHSMLVASTQTSHGRATPLMWKTVKKKKLKNKRNDYEDFLLLGLRELIPAEVKVTIVADRGFCDTAFFWFLEERLGFEYIIRFRGNIVVTNQKGERRRAAQWVGAGGRMKVLRNARVTAKGHQVTMVVCVQDKGMSSPWCLAVSDPELKGTKAKRLYGKRFSCEETFRDVKDFRFGLGMKLSHIKDPDRRDRLMFLASLALALLTLLGEAGERAGLDRLLKVNTSPRRQLSLFRQGLRWYALIPTMREDRLKLLIEHLVEVVTEHELGRRLFGTV